MSLALIAWVSVMAFLLWRFYKTNLVKLSTESDNYRRSYQLIIKLTRPASLEKLGEEVATNPYAQMIFFDPLQLNSKQLQTIKRSTKHNNVRVSTTKQGLQRHQSALDSGKQTIELVNIDDVDRTTINSLLHNAAKTNRSHKIVMMSSEDNKFTRAIENTYRLLLVWLVDAHQGKLSTGHKANSYLLCSSDFGARLSTLKMFELSLLSMAVFISTYAYSVQALTLTPIWAVLALYSLAVIYMLSRANNYSISYRIQILLLWPFALLAEVIDTIKQIYKLGSYNKNA